MENAAKALKIAAGILLGLLITSLVVFGYSQIRDYYQKKKDNQVEKQVREFNREYEAYARNNLTGNDIISLVNKVYDYNKRLDGTKSEQKVYIKIDLKADINTKLSYSTDYQRVYINNRYITNQGSMDNLENFINFTSWKDEEAKYQKLVNKISKILLSSSELTDSQKTDERDDIFKNILGKKYSDLTITARATEINKMLAYNAFQEFKKLKFEYVRNEYYENGRIKYLEIRRR